MNFSRCFILSMVLLVLLGMHGCARNRETYDGQPWMDEIAVVYRLSDCDDPVCADAAPVYERLNQYRILTDDKYEEGAIDVAYAIYARRMADRIRDELTTAVKTSDSLAIKTWSSVLDTVEMNLEVLHSPVQSGGQKQ